MDKLNPPRFRAALLAPRYWLTWLLFGLWFLVAQLPYGVQWWLGTRLGRLTYRFAKRRRTIAETNIRLCFPELDAGRQQQLVRDTMESTTFALFETGMAWFWPRRRLARLFEFGDLESLKALQRNQKGALLLILHFTTLEMAGIGYNLVFDNLAMTYRPHNNRVYDLIQSWGRSRHNPAARVVPARNIRSMVKAMRDGAFLSYFPDQDYGRKQSTFAPFFGVETATVTAMPRLVSLSSAPVVPVMCMRDPVTRKYRLWAGPAWTDYPTGDERADATRLNRHVEDTVRLDPAQYLWVHRRFKTRPPGEPDLYRKPR